jgi:hypothetical protein
MSDSAVLFILLVAFNVAAAGTLYSFERLFERGGK